MPRAQNIGSEDPGIDIPLPTPLNKHLMKELNLIDNRHPKPIHQYFRAWYGLNQRDEKVPAQRSHARGFLHHQKAWIEIMCRGGLVLWWQPFRNLVRYEMPTGLQPKRDRSCYVVTGYGGVSKRYHKHSRRILPPVPVMNSGNVTFQMFSTVLASCPMPNDIHADLADFNALRAAAFRCGPTLSKKRFRLLVYSCVDQFATLTLNSPAIRVNLLSVILNLQSTKRKAADDSNKKDAKKPAVSPVERRKNHNKHSSSRQHGTEDVAKNTDRDDSPVIVQEEDGRRSIYPGKEINPDDDDFQGRILLAEAVRERYLHAGVFHKQERYIDYLWDHRDCPERWPFKISSRQQNAINQISRAVETWIESSATTKWIYSGTSSKEDKTRFEEAKKLIRLLFEEDCTRRHGVNQAAIAYEPIELNAKRGTQKNYCPRDIRPRVFGSIKDYLLNPLLARNGLPIVNFMGHHVDGDDDENHDAKTRLRVIDAARLPFLWSALMKKVDGGWIGEIDGLWADFTRSEDITIV